jgi:hypothetical protein
LVADPREELYEFLLGHPGLFEFTANGLKCLV